MLVSHRHHFIYTKTVKTAGTSVEVYFEPYCVAPEAVEEPRSRGEKVSPEGIVGFRGPNHERAGSTWWNHMPAAAIREQLGDEIWHSYFKFAVIRDPFDKAVSNFHFAQSKRPTSGLLAAARRWLSTPAKEVRTSFKQWLRAGGLVLDRDKYLIDGQVCLDYFIRYEQLAEGIQKVCEKVGVSFEPEKIPRLKSSSRPDHALAEYYDAEAIDLVAASFRWELDYFGYAPPV